ncbi:cell adhesion molecule 3-like [Mytilus edulis]|uniref:cell adhesion molecule 3-like n=1 Tax=Mytilus edulis TaxID=6550 RepID=UPI0039F0ECD8
MNVLGGVLFLVALYPSSAQQYVNTVTVTPGLATALTCHVKNLDNSKEVIWVGPSGSPLTIGKRNVTTDSRIYIEQPYANVWKLHITRVKLSDAGDYTCKVESTPPQVSKVKLIVKDTLSTSTNSPTQTDPTGMAPSLRMKNFEVFCAILLLSFLVAQLLR